MMFEGFERLRVKTEEAEIEAVKKSGGPPLLLVQRQSRRALPVLRRSHSQNNAHPHQLLPR